MRQARSRLERGPAPRADYAAKWGIPDFGIVPGDHAGFPLHLLPAKSPLFRAVKALDKFRRKFPKNGTFRQ
jgi:hypothetical protein